MTTETTEAPETVECLTLAELKANSPKDLLAMAEELEIENASTMRKGEIISPITYSGASCSSAASRHLAGALGAMRP